MPAGATYEPIATTTVSGSAAEITFSSIPSTYTDLRLVVYGFVSAVSGADTLIRFNSDTGTNYSWTELFGSGSGSGSSFRYTNQNYIQITGSSYGTSYGGLTTVDIFNYAGSTNKTVLGVGARDSNGSGYVTRCVGLWRNTSAINSINIRTSYDLKMGVGSMATLYGIKNSA